METSAPPSLERQASVIDGLSRQISRALAGQRRLLVLDDVWTAEQLGAFEALTAEGGLLGRLVTTRSDELAVAHCGAAAKVDALGDEEALRVLAAYKGGEVKTEEERADALWLVRKCNGNPAMLRQVAVNCRTKGLKGARGYLEKASGQAARLGDRKAPEGHAARRR